MANDLVDAKIKEMLAQQEAIMRAKGDMQAKTQVVSHDVQGTRRAGPQPMFQADIRKLLPMMADFEQYISQTAKGGFGNWKPELRLWMKSAGTEIQKNFERGGTENRPWRAVDRSTIKNRDNPRSRSVGTPPLTDFGKLTIDNTRSGTNNKRFGTHQDMRDWKREIDKTIADQEDAIAAAIQKNNESREARSRARSGIKPGEGKSRTLSTDQSLHGKGESGDMDSVQHQEIKPLEQDSAEALQSRAALRGSRSVAHMIQQDEWAGYSDARDKAKQHLAAAGKVIKQANSSLAKLKAKQTAFQESQKRRNSEIAAWDAASKKGDKPKTARPRAIPDSHASGIAEDIKHHQERLDEAQKRTSQMQQGLANLQRQTRERITSRNKSYKEKLAAKQRADRAAERAQKREAKKKATRESRKTGGRINRVVREQFSHSDVENAVFVKGAREKARFSQKIRAQNERIARLRNSVSLLEKAHKTPYQTKSNKAQRMQHGKHVGAWRGLKAAASNWSPDANPASLARLAKLEADIGVNFTDSGIPYGKYHMMQRPFMVLPKKMQHWLTELVRMGLEARLQGKSDYRGISPEGPNLT